MIRKFFPFDKNYLLESAQLSLQDSLLHLLVAKTKVAYEIHHNPLGLNDDFVEKIQSYQPKNIKPLNNFYQNLAGVYRFRHGETQLTFIWDGKDHHEKYGKDWCIAFDQWTSAFCRDITFIQAVLDLTVFLPENRHAHLAENRMNYFILQHFEVKIYKTKGILCMDVA